MKPSPLRLARIPLLVLPGLLAFGSIVHAQARPAAPAAAVAGPTPAQETHAAARAFDLNSTEVRAYCNETPELGKNVEAAWAQFRQRNPDFVAALASRPSEPDFVAASQEFERNVPKIRATLRERIRRTPAATMCPAAAAQLGEMKFSDLMAEARRQRAAAQSKAQPQPPAARPQPTGP